MYVQTEDETGFVMLLLGNDKVNGDDWFRRGQVGACSREPGVSVTPPKG